MNLPKHPILLAVSLAALTLPAWAVVNIDFVNVGNAGNAADPATGSVYGAVAYAYNIAKNETTIAQYSEFLNAVAKTDTYGLYSTSMTISYINGISRSGLSGSFIYSVTAGSGNKPITNVSWFDAARYANWLHNGQPTGAQTVATTEGGAYTLNGATNGVSVSKNVGATVWIPSENEWYKAAYYDPTKSGGIGGYWQQANQSNVMPGNTVGVAGSANVYDGDYVGSGSSSFPMADALTEVGAYGANSASYYETSDQAGNVFEWTDAVGFGSSRVLRGGSWIDSTTAASSSVRFEWTSVNQDVGVGFRLASVPEPTTGLLAFLGLIPLLSRRREA